MLYYIMLYYSICVVILYDMILTTAGALRHRFPGWPLCGARNATLPLLSLVRRRGARRGFGSRPLGGTDSIEVGVPNYTTNNTHNNNDDTTTTTTTATTTNNNDNNHNNNDKRQCPPLHRHLCGSPSRRDAQKAAGARFASPAPPPTFLVPPAPIAQSSREFRGNHLSNATCLTHVSFKSDESCSNV